MPGSIRRYKKRYSTVPPLVMHAIVGGKEREIVIKN